MMKMILHNIYRLVIIVGAGWGLAIMFGAKTGEWNFSQLIFYTIQSNLVIFLAYLGLVVVSIVKTVRKKRATDFSYPPLIMGGLMAMIALTGIVYNFVLAPAIPDEILYALDATSNWLLHTFVPLAVFMDWLLFTDMKNVRWWYPLAWTATPLAYFAFAMIRAQVGGPIMRGASYYPYFFIDVDIYGAWGVARNVILIAAVFGGMGYGLMGVGRLMRRGRATTK
jgi:hypothetical protein